MKNFLRELIGLNRLGLMFLLAFLVAVPFVCPNYISIFIEFTIAALFAVSFNLVFGYGKMVSIGHAAFYAVGGYTCALLAKKLGVPLPLAVLGGISLASLVGLIIGYFSIRLTAFYLAFVSLAFAQVIWGIIWKWYDLTGGDDGLVGIPIPSFISSAASPSRFYYFTLVVVGISIFILKIIVDSPFGYFLRSSRDNPERTECIGGNVMKIRLLAWIISAFFSGIAGCLMVLKLHGAFPDMAYWTKSADVTLMALVGGMFTFSGPIIGAGVMVFIHYFLTFYTKHWMLIMGTILIIFVLFLPNGIMGFIQAKYQNRK